MIENTIMPETFGTGGGGLKTIGNMEFVLWIHEFYLVQ